jgi:hypothetical protein
MEGMRLRRLLLRNPHIASWPEGLRKHSLIAVISRVHSLPQ